MRSPTGPWVLSLRSCSASICGIQRLHPLWCDLPNPMFHDQPLTFFYRTAVRVVEHVAHLYYFATDFLLENLDSLKMALLSFLIADSSHPSINGTNVASQHPIRLWHKEPLCN